MVQAYLLDPKAITKDQLFGSLDITTREWTDGLFTAILRKIVDNLRGENSKRHWISTSLTRVSDMIHLVTLFSISPYAVFDGDVDPEWVENLNSLLDDNKLLTLPNGERLALPNNVRVMFEVQDLRYATPATVSRCGMVWFSEETLTLQMIFNNYLTRLRSLPFDENERDQLLRQKQIQENPDQVKESVIPPGLKVQRDVADVLQKFFEEEGLVEKCLAHTATKEHIMDLTRLRVLESMFSLMNKGVNNIIEYNQTHPDFPLPIDILEKYVSNRLCYAIMWGFGGSLSLAERENFGRFIMGLATTSMPDISGPSLLVR